MRKLLYKLGKRVRGDRHNTHTSAVVAKDTGWVSLCDAHHFPEAVGHTAVRLGQVIAAGFDVPPGFVITEQFASKLAQQDARADHCHSVELDTDTRIDALWTSLNTQKVTVRSSDTRGTHSDAHMAAVYETRFDVTREGLIDAVTSVYESLQAARSLKHNTQRLAGHSHPTENTNGILIQTMVDAQYSGVLCTRHPDTSGAMLVELVQGPGQDLIRGYITPEAYAFGKISSVLNKHAGRTDPPLDLTPLLDIGRRLESLFGAPQDIEWAWAKGRFYVSKVHDLAHLSAAENSTQARAERERTRLLTELKGRRRQIRNRAEIPVDSELLARSELSERLPRPTPVSADLMRRLWEVGGATDLASQQLDVPYSVHGHSSPYLTTLFGWTYVNRQEEARRKGKGPGALACFRLSRDANAIADRFVDEYLPTFRAEVIERNAIAFDGLPLNNALLLLEAWVDRFVTQTSVEVERLNICTNLYMTTAKEKLAKADIEPDSVLGGEVDSIAAQAKARLLHNGVDNGALEEFFITCGHRAPHDFELAHPRFNEDETLVKGYIESVVPAIQQKADENDKVFEGKQALQDSVKRAQRFQTLTEDARHYSLIELSQIRQLLLSIDRIAGLDGQIFELEFNEIYSLKHAHRREELMAIADQRLELSLAWSDLGAPVSLSLDDLERMNLVTGQFVSGALETSALSGSRVAGNDAVIGRARVITDAAQIVTFEQGEILVARMINPDWYPLFDQARGVILEVGGLLAHPSTIARHLDVPTVVGVKGACSKIKTGDVIRLQSDGRISIEGDLLDASEALQSTMERQGLKDVCDDQRDKVRTGRDDQPEPSRRGSDRPGNSSVYRRPA